MIDITAHAKVNLFLEITGKLSNGYHTVDTIMQSVSLTDMISLELLPRSFGISITCNDRAVPVDERNIAYKTAKAYLDKAGCNCGVSVHIEKRIPSQAGMGGGSADGAAVLVALDKLCDGALTRAELFDVAASIGADIPFCIDGGTQRLVGTGTENIASYNMPELDLVIAKPPIGISTPSAYAFLDSLHGDFFVHKPVDPENMIAFLLNQTKEIEMFNRFEETLDALCPDSKALIDFMNKNSHGALLSGSGTAVFAIADSHDHANKLSDLIASAYPDYFVTNAHTIARGCVIN